MGFALPTGRGAMRLSSRESKRWGRFFQFLMDWAAGEQSTLREDDLQRYSREKAARLLRRAARALHDMGRPEHAREVFDIWCHYGLDTHVFTLHRNSAGERLNSLLWAGALVARARGVAKSYKLIAGALKDRGVPLSPRAIMMRVRRFEAQQHKKPDPDKPRVLEELFDRFKVAEYRKSHPGRLPALSAVNGRFMILRKPDRDLVAKLVKGRALGRRAACYSASSPSFRSTISSMSSCASSSRTAT